MRLSENRPYRFPLLPCLLGALLFLFSGLFNAPGQEGDGATRPRPGASRGEELVRRIQEGMKKIDENLLNASAEGVKENLEENLKNIDELLEDTRSRSSQVIEDLDELIRSVKYQQSGGGGRSDTPPKPDEEKPKPRQEQQDDELKQNPDQMQNEENRENQQPEEGRPDDAPPKPEEAKNPPDSKEPEKTDHIDQSGRWGVLPPKIQSEILNFNIENFPQKYRKWLEEYYKRVNNRRH